MKKLKPIPENVGFLYTVVLNLLLSREIKTSRKGILLFCSTSMVIDILGCLLFTYAKKSWAYCFYLKIKKTIINISRITNRRKIGRAV